jgi:hypothetical protein
MGSPVTVTKVTEFKHVRKIYFKAKGTHGHWTERKEEDE